MLPQCSHITRKRRVYYYRRRLPKPFTGEVAISLRTKVFLEADWLSQRLDVAFNQVLHRMSETTRPADIAKIAQDHLRDSLQHELAVRARFAGQAPVTRWEKWSNSLNAVEL